MDKACRTNGERSNSYRITLRKPEGKRSLEIPIRRWVDNIKMELKRDRTGWYRLD
jgi:hypothetical protein